MECSSSVWLPEQQQLVKHMAGFIQCRNYIVKQLWGAHMLSAAVYTTTLDKTIMQKNDISSHVTILINQTQQCPKQS